MVKGDAGPSKIDEGKGGGVVQGEREFRDGYGSEIDRWGPLGRAIGLSQARLKLPRDFPKCCMHPERSLHAQRKTTTTQARVDGQAFDARAYISQ